ncbi:MAG: hypothetical protein M3Q65_09870 [Chloroflexota bacterium]|nr:hypothetical protein [Chloroflexota bacterium]
MSGALISIGAIVLFLAIGLDKLRRLNWRPRDAGERAGCLGFFIAAPVFTLFLPPVSAVVNRWTGIPDTARLLANILSVAGCWAYQPAIDQFADVPQGKRGLARLTGNVWLMVGTVGALAALFGLATRAGEHQTATWGYMAYYGNGPFALAYTGVFMGYMELTAFRLLHLSWRLDRLIDRPDLHLRARLQTAGWGLAVLYGVHEWLHALLRYLGLTYPAPGAAVVTSGIVGCGVLLTMSGGFLDLYGWGTRYRAYRQLYPLWRDLHRATPQIALTALFRPPRSALEDALAINDIGLRLYRRTIKIQDGAVALQPYTDASVEDDARTLCHRCSLAPKETHAVVKATGLAGAIRAKRLKHRVTRPATIHVNQDAANFASEVTYLQQVARAYSRSPIVSAVLAADARTRERP